MVPPRQPFGARAGRREAEAQQQDREREHHVGQAREDRVDRAAVEAGDQPDRDADDHREAGRDERDLERDPGAVDRAREDVATELVDAEPVLGGRSGRAAEEVERVRVLRLRIGRAEDRDDHRREDRHEDQGDDEAQRRHRDLVAAQPAPEELERRARGDRRLARAAALDDDRVLVLLVDQPDGIARAHGRAPALQMPLMKMSIPPASPGSPRPDANEQFPKQSFSRWPVFPATRLRSAGSVATPTPMSSVYDLPLPAPIAQSDRATPS